MKKLEYTVEFVTPAFLGNAEQSAQWRTPPFKTLLRQWWRVLNANLSIEELRKKEGELFGVALDDTGLQSRVRIRLGKWSTGTLKDWKKIGDVNHPEVGNMDSSLYLGYGPIAKGAKLKSNAAIQSKENATFTLIVDDKKISGSGLQLSDAVQLAHWFGTLGGRSRNGWGSAQFVSKGEPLQSFDQLMQSPLVKKISLPLSDCLSFDYPSALGKDEQGALIWKAKASANNWEDAMKKLAEIKIAMRTSFVFKHGDGSPMEDRHILSYPVTNHVTIDYEYSFNKIKNKYSTKARLPNQLRFKVHKTSDGKFLPVAFHFPVKTPKNVFANGIEKMTKNDQLAVWKKAHAKMDELMERLK